MSKDTEDPEEERPFWRIFLGGTIGFIIVSLVIAGIEAKVHGAELAPAAPSSEVAGRCAPGDPCMAPYTPRGGVRRFRHHRIKNSAHVVFGPRVMHKIERKYDRMHGRFGVMARDAEHWWEKPFHETQCLLWQVQYRGRWGGNCRTQKYVEDVARIRKDVAHTTHVWIGCSAKYVVGMYVYKRFEDGVWKIGRKGWWGVGAGSALCLFDAVFDQWWG